MAVISDNFVVITTTPQGPRQNIVSVISDDVVLIKLNRPRYCVQSTLKKQHTINAQWRSCEPSKLL